MHRIWRVVLEPLLRRLDPRVIVETGIGGAPVHRDLLALCRQLGATLHSVEDIDEALDELLGDTADDATADATGGECGAASPDEVDEVGGVIAENGTSASPYRTSRDDGIDVVLVGKESTWHSVSGLLERIDDWRREHDREFPMVILRGARRVRYQTTSNGTRPEASGLAEAIDGFLSRCEAELTFVSVPVLDGIGFVFPEEWLESVPGLETHFEGLAFLEEQADAERRRIEVDRDALAARDDRIERLERQRDELQVWFEELAGNTRQILNSRRWKVGNAMAEMQRRLLLKRRSFRGHLETRMTIDQFRAWKHGRMPFPESRRTAVLGMREGTTAVETFDLEGAGLSVDVVVCVHDALDETRACLQSVVESRVPPEHRLIVVNDGSTEPTTKWLRDFAERHRHVMLIEVPEAEGYTKAANRGLRESAADYVVLLNSDTVVPSCWLEGIVECGESDAGVGIVGPLSNAATWQSVPELNRDGRWAINEIPRVEGVEESADLIRLVSPKKFPRVPFLNGFCYAIKRKVIHDIGYLDEQGFPRGYGEEDDYSYRARQAGFRLAVADHVFVQHEKSRSYGQDERDRLSKAGRKVLNRRYGEDRIRQDSKTAREHRGLAAMRDRVRAAMRAVEFRPDPRLAGERVGRDVEPARADRIARPVSPRSPLRVAFVLPSLEVRGTVLSTLQHVNELNRLGARAELVVRSRRSGAADWHLTRDPIVLKKEEDFRERFPSCDVAVATTGSTVAAVAAAVDGGRAEHAVHMLEDWEPWLGAGSARAAAAADAADAVADAQGAALLEAWSAIPDKIVVSDWLRGLLAKHGHGAVKIPVGLDLDLLFPRSMGLGLEPKPRVLALARFATPRHGFPHVIETLRVLKDLRPEVEVVLFGEDLSTFQVPFEHLAVGVVTDPNRLAELYSSSTVFFDGSNFHGAARPVLEAMACGTPTVATDVGGIHEFARDGWNVRLVAPGDPDAAAAAIRDLLDDPVAAEEIRQGGFRTVERLDMRTQAERLLDHLQGVASGERLVAG